MTQEIVCRHSQFSLFVAIHGGFNGLNGARGTGLYFDEAEHLLVPADQIEFSAMMWRTIVPGDDDVAFPSKIEIRLFFAATTGTLVRGHVLRGKSVGSQPIQCAQRDLSDAAGKHERQDAPRVTISSALFQRCDGGHAALGTFPAENDTHHGGTETRSKFGIRTYGYPDS